MYNFLMSKNMQFINLYIRITLFVVYAYFGIWKIFGLSPAESLVTELYNKTLSSFLSIGSFLVILGIVEVLIGIGFLLTRGKFLKLVICIFSLHMVTTFATLVLLPHIAFSPFPIPTLVGQYVIKNLALIGLVLVLHKTNINLE